MLYPQIRGPLCELFTDGTCGQSGTNQRPHYICLLGQRTGVYNFTQGRGFILRKCYAYSTETSFLACSGVLDVKGLIGGSQAPLGF